MKYLTSPQAAALGADCRTVGVIAVGALEQHGPHLPISMDAMLTDTIATSAADLVIEPVLVTPVIQAGLSDHHLGFPGTVSVDRGALRATIEAFIRAFTRTGIKRIALLSGHGGNFGLFREMVSEEEVKGDLQVHAYDNVQRYLAAQRRGARNAGLSPLETDIHSGVLETSMALYMFGAERVGPFEDVEGYTAGEVGWMERMSSQGIHSLSQVGVLGRPRGATKEAGKAIIESVAGDVADWLEESFGLTRHKTAHPETRRD